MNLMSSLFARASGGHSAKAGMDRSTQGIFPNRCGRPYAHGMNLTLGSDGFWSARRPYLCRWEWTLLSVTPYDGQRHRCARN
jgi:hypothetical protein